MLSLRALTHFSALVEERNYSRAALRLHLTQSALSRSIQSLEDALGLKLVDRTSSGMALTQTGQMVMEYARRILGEAAALRREAELIRGFDTGRVVFGVGVFPADGFLSPLLMQLAREHPGLSVHVEIESWQRLLDKLRQDKLDFVVAVTHSLPPSSEFTARPLPPQHGGLFVRRGHPLLKVRRADLRGMLNQYRLAATDLPLRAREHLARLYRVTSPDLLPIGLECDSVATLRDVALNSDMVLFSTHEAIQHQIDAGLLQPLPLAYSASGTLTYSIIHRERRTLSPAAERVIALIYALLPTAAGQKGGDASSEELRQAVKHRPRKIMQ
ncbi:LysR family transcriptional regulator [Paralcaligenes sp. KSB-10]|uniref:LysR family transcriptional regulator n=1 Tax=Paralcaligenes sp. KSB-10 TaxID=2901142 RepID=UPI001E58D1CF|nr:LysR family transcriptional regulator [Paralcaligenes sp. KSB-10]UHL64389.1 LysR family transcriptional regulator [Paralcaligenes sp. KSB-10]